MPHKTPKIILGLANAGDAADANVRFDTPAKLNALLDEFYRRGYRTLDSARVYPPGKPGTTEPLLADALRASTVATRDEPFVVDTKVWSATPGAHAPASIARSVDESVGLFKGLVAIDVEYLHQPDRSVPFADTLGALAAQRQQGKFKRIGISNYRADEVEALVEIASAISDSGIQPAVYQGSYNAVSRGLEADLIPTLRKHGIALYAYSPTAGGLFSEQARTTAPGSRYDPKMTFAAVFAGIYKTPAIEAAVQHVRDACVSAGISGHEAALRWVVHHSALSGEHGDGVVLGVSSVAQLRGSLDAIDAGPLPADVLAAVEAIATSISEEEKQGFRY